MTSDLDVLRELIHEDALARFEAPDHGRRVAVLEEAGDPDRYSIRIKGIPKDAVVIRTDAFPAPKDTFKCRRGECKRADYVIVASSGMKSYVVHVEMKKGKGNPRDIVAQLKGSECFVSYCRAIACRFWSRPDFLAPCESRFVSITKIGISKSRTREPRYPGRHDTPESMLKLDNIKDGGGVHFSRLING